MSVSWPRDLSFEANVGASAATINAAVIVGRSRYTGIVSAVAYIPSASVTGASGDSRTLTLVNRGTGAGTVSVASLALTSGNNLTDNVAATITLATGSARTVAVGDVLEWVSTAQSAGLADPGGLVIAQIALR